MQFRVNCPHCNAYRMYEPRNIRNVNKARIKCFTCNKYFRVREPEKWTSRIVGATE